MTNLPIAANANPIANSTPEKPASAGEQQEHPFTNYLDQVEAQPESSKIEDGTTTAEEVAESTVPKPETDELVFAELRVFPYLRVELPAASQNGNAIAPAAIGENESIVAGTLSANIGQLFGTQAEFVTPEQALASTGQGFTSPEQGFEFYHQNSTVEENLATALEPNLETDDVATHAKSANSMATVPGGQVVYSADQTDVVVAANQQSVLAPHKNAAMQVAAVFTTGLTSLKKEPIQTISLDLHPAELGHLKIRVEQTPDQLMAHIIASEANSSDLLLQEKDFLLQALADLGFGETSLDISHGDGGGSDSNTGNSFANTKSRELEFEIKPEWKNQFFATPGGINFVA